MKKLLTITAFIIAFMSITFVYTFAAENTTGDTLNNVGDGVKNVIGAAENVIENAAKSATNAVQDGTNAIENNNVVDSAKNTITDGANGTKNVIENTTNDNKMNMWTWIIIIGVAILMILLFWYIASKTSDKE